MLNKFIIDNNQKLSGNNIFLGGAILDDEPSILSNNNNDIVSLKVNSTGVLYTVISANSGVDIGNVDVI